jgi:hypothetical protein
LCPLLGTHRFQRASFDDKPISIKHCNMPFSYRLVAKLLTYNQYAFNRESTLEAMRTQGASNRYALSRESTLEATRTQGASNRYALSRESTLEAMRTQGASNRYALSRESTLEAMRTQGASNQYAFKRARAGSDGRPARG